MFKICVFVPEAAAEQVKQAMFAAGAGRIGDYDCCCWQVPGQGQFRPLAGSSPFIGKQDTLETVAELRIEMVCADGFIKAAIAALKSSHPYEEPAYDVWKLEDL
ncbi:MAG: YqfO family protein [Gammaproteobacteria bacterium]